MRRVSRPDCLHFRSVLPYLESWPHQTALQGLLARLLFPHRSALPTPITAGPLRSALRQKPSLNARGSRKDACLMARTSHYWPVRTLMPLAQMPSRRNAVKQKRNTRSRVETRRSALRFGNKTEIKATDASLTLSVGSVITPLMRILGSWNWCRCCWGQPP